MRIEQHRARRPRSRAGGLWSRLRRAVGRCWRGQGGRRRAGRKETEKGVLGAFLLFPPLPTARVGAGGAGLDHGVSQEHGYRPEANSDSDQHSKLDLLDFHLSSVRRNARKKFKFEFLKISTLGDQHMSQGIQ
jgi:hypothetical protein